MNYCLDETDFKVIDENISSLEDTSRRFQHAWSPADTVGTVCGFGSTEHAIENISNSLSYIFKALNVKKINDAGCGDFAWPKKVDLSNIDYMGYDVTQWNKQDTFKFKRLDIINQKMRKADLIICRDVLFHVPNNLVSKALQTMKASKSTYRVWRERYRLDPLRTRPHGFRMGRPIPRSATGHETQRLLAPAMQGNVPVRYHRREVGRRHGH